MSKDIYSFVKIERKQTRLGRVSSGMAAASIACMGILLVVSFVRGGEVARFVPTIGYCSALVSMIALFISLKLQENTELYGGMVQASLYISFAAVILHAAIFLVGCFVSVV